MKQLFFRALLVIITRHARFVMMIATGLAIASALITFGQLDVKTNFKDTLDEDVDTVANATYIKDNFPSASMVYVTVEGVDRSRMTAAAREVERRLLAEKEHVGTVHLRLNTDFFKNYGLVYLKREDLVQLLRAIREYRESLERVVQDPGLTTLLAQIEGSIDRGYASGETSFVLTQRITGGLVFEQSPFPGVGQPGGLQLQSKIDRNQLREQYEKTLVPLLEKMPLPPSEQQFIVWLQPVIRACQLSARILHEGTEVSPELPRLLRELENYQYAALGELPDEYRISADGTMLLMEVSAADDKDIHDLDEGKEIIATIERVLDEVEEDFPEVKLGQTGFPVMYAEENEAVMDNFVVVFLLSIVGVLMVFIIGFGQARLPGVSAIPLLYGLLYTFAIHTIAVGELNMISLMFPVLFMGLGIDFGIHLISGFVEYREKGLSAEAAMGEALETVGGGIVTGALTTSAAFFAMLLANYKGVKHLGFISGVGIVMALTTMLTVLPILVLWIDKREVKSGHPIYSVDFKWLRPLTRFCLRNRYILLAAFLGITVFFAGQATELELDRNVMNIQPKGLSSALLQEKILEKFDLSAEYAVFVAEDLEEARHIQDALEQRNTVREVWSITRLLPEEKKQAENRPWIEAIRREIEATGRLKRFDCSGDPAGPEAAGPDLGATPEDLAPFLEDRMRRRRIADAIRRESGEPVPDRVSSLKKSLARIKLAILDLSIMARVLYSPEVETLVGYLRDAVNAIDQSVAPGNEIGLELLDYVLERQFQRIFCQLESMAAHSSLDPEDLPGDLVERFIDRTGERYIVIAYPSQFPFEKRFLQRHVEELETITVPRKDGPAPPAAGTEAEAESPAARDKPRFSGVVPIWKTMIDKILYTLPRTLLGTLVMVVLLLLVDLRSIKGVLLCMVPLASGLIWSLGILPLMGLKINVVSIMALPLIIGIAIDNGVHIFHRIVHEGESRIEDAVESTGKPVLLTTLTSIIGFGSLMASVHQGFFHLGMVLSIGMVVCYLATVLMVPALMEIFWFTQTKPLWGRKEKDAPGP